MLKDPGAAQTSTIQLNQRKPVLEMRPREFALKASASQPSFNRGVGAGGFGQNLPPRSRMAGGTRNVWQARGSRMAAGALDSRGASTEQGANILQPSSQNRPEHMPPLPNAANATEVG